MKRIIMVLSIMFMLLSSQLYASTKTVDQGLDAYEAAEKHFEAKNYAAAEKSIDAAFNSIKAARLEKKPKAPELRKMVEEDIEHLEFSSYGLRSTIYLMTQRFPQTIEDSTWVIRQCNEKEFWKGEKYKNTCEETLFKRGTSYFREGKYEQAIVDFTWLVKNNQGNLAWFAYESRAKTYLALENYKEALIHYDELIKVYPPTAKYYSGRCKANFGIFESGEEKGEADKKRGEQTINDCKKARELDPKDLFATVTLMKMGLMTMEDEDDSGSN